MNHQTLGNLRDRLALGGLWMSGAGRGIVSDNRREPVIFADTAATFALLAAPALAHVLWLLARGENDIRVLAEQTGVNLSTINGHLARLHLAGLVTARGRRGHQFYVVDDAHVLNMISQAVEHHSRHR